MSGAGAGGGGGGGVTVRVAELGAAMRRRGGQVGGAQLLLAVRGLACVDASSREDVRLALRSVMCAQRADLARFDEAFLEVFGAPGSGIASDPGEDVARLGGIPREVLPRAGAADPGRGRPSPDAETVPAAWSEVEVLLEKDFAHYTEAEASLARALIAQLARRQAMRPSRRTRSSRRRGHLPDLRGTVQASLRTGGDPVHRRWRRRTERPRPLVIVCDVSGSMTPYARMLLQYMQAAVTARHRVEAFVFGTRLTRVTAELDRRDPDEALRRATAAVSDFSGGTRIGDALSALNRDHGRRVGRGAVVVILSDGWDRGDPERLGAEMARLRRTAFRVIWLNPLAAHPDYAPLTRGMRAAVPHVDRLLAGNSVASLRDLADTLESL